MFYVRTPNPSLITFITPDPRTSSKALLKGINGGIWEEGGTLRIAACLSCTGSVGWPRRGPNLSRLSWSLQGQNSASRRRRAAPKPIFLGAGRAQPRTWGAAAAAAARSDNTMRRSFRERRKKPSGHLQQALAVATSQFLHHTDTRSPFNACMSECRLQRDRDTGAGTFGVAVSNPAAPGAETRAGCPAPRPGGPGRLRGRKLRSLCQGSSRLRQTNRKKK